MSKTKIDGTLVKSGLKSVSNTVDRLLTTKYMKYQWRVETKNVFGTEDRTYYGDSCTLYVDQVDTANTPYFRGYTDDGVVMEYTVEENEFTLGYKGTHIEYDGKVYTDLEGSIVLTSTSDITGYLSYDGNDSTGDIHLPINTVHVTAMNMGKVTDVNVSYNTDNGTATISWNYSTTYTGDVSYVIADEFGNILYTTENKNITLPVGVENADYRIIVRWVVLDNFYKAPTYETVTVTGTDPSEPLPDHYTEMLLWNYENESSSATHDTEYSFVVSNISTMELAEGEDVYVNIIPETPGAKHRLYTYSVDGDVEAGTLTVPVYMSETIRIYAPRPGSAMFSGNNDGSFKLTLNKFDTGWTHMVTAFSGCANLYEVKSWDGASDYESAYSAFGGCTGLKMLPHVDYAEPATYGCVGRYDFTGLSSITNARTMFAACTSLDSSYEITFNGLDCLSIGDQMFVACMDNNAARVFTVDFSTLPTDNNVTMGAMFAMTRINVKNFVNLATFMSTNLTTVTGAMAQVCGYVNEIFSWEGIGECDGMKYLFSSSGLQKIPDTWDGFNIKNASGWFANCDISEIPTTWAGAESLVLADNMFDNCTKLTKIPYSWYGLNKLVSISSMFASCPLKSGGDSGIENLSNVVYAGGLFYGSDNALLTATKVHNYYKVLNTAMAAWMEKAGAVTIETTQYTDYDTPSPTGSGYSTVNSNRHKVSSWTDISDAVDDYLNETYGITRTITTGVGNRYVFNGTLWSPGNMPIYETSNSGPAYGNDLGSYMWLLRVGTNSVKWSDYWASDTYYSSLIHPITMSNTGDVDYYYFMQ